MSTRQPDMSAFLKCALEGDEGGMAMLVAQGVDLKKPDRFGDSPLTQLIEHLQYSPEEHVLRMVKLAVRLGADPRQTDVDRHDVFGPLVGAMLGMRTEVLRFLLESGADPNALIDEGKPISLYGWAWSDYQLEVWMGNPLPEQPSEIDKVSEESWIAFFDRLAVKYGRRRPDYLTVLREFGALTDAEMAQRRTGSGNSSV
ncbi:hypothetical protein QCE62_05675 [Caballeronia sp. LZ033]|uniref:hypothetical protein n=1 Tax=Caballeronia sp. LZ033 TaxID=3038566 RepID=UPI00286760DC|nr:hypothetical protein [Caballeronia sp. LZ033]MDR5813079.1 hypothetical protein [Caballeronia sp. LZ033]